MSLKLFQLVSVINKADFCGEKFKGCIQCIESAQNNLYIATTDFFLLHFAIEKVASPLGETLFSNKLQRRKYLGLAKPIKCLLACPSIGQLLLLTDNIVYCLSMIGLEFPVGSRKELFKGVTAMARNDKPPIFKDDEVQICIGTYRKTVQIIELTNNMYTILREISLRSSPSLLSMDFEMICAVVGRQYFLINCVTCAVQDLFKCEENNVEPAIKRTGHEEFLLNGPTDEMGMIVTAGGISQHQPFWWKDSFHSVAYYYPYILILGKGTVTVHSILDQKQKQVISFMGGKILDNLDGNVFIALERSLMSFVMVSFRKQIQVLLVEKRIDEAFELLLVASKMDPKAYDKTFIKQVNAQAGFIYFSDADFTKAMHLFIESSLDPREIIVLYPLMMTKGNDFKPSRPLLHNIDTLASLVKGSRTIFANYKKFLLDYLEMCRHRHSKAYIEVDTALMKVYAECNHSRLVQLVSTENRIIYEEALSWLVQFKRYHSLAMYHTYKNDYDKALDIWHKLIDKKFVDNNFPGIDFVCQMLGNVGERDSIWNAMAWLLEKDQTIAVKVFTERKEEDYMNSDKVYEFLQKFPIALRIYLENVIVKQNCVKEEFHTRLAVIYADDVLRLRQETIRVEEEITRARSVLRKFLETSSLYRVSVILQKIMNCSLYEELAILYGKMGKHDKALKILVYQLKDYKVAERYCTTVSAGKDEKWRQNLFYSLLLTYLYPDEECGVRPEHFVIPAMKLLNSHQSKFDVLKVIEILPDDWPVEMISAFLSGGIRNSLTNFYKTKVETNICRIPFIDTKFDEINHRFRSINITVDTCCQLCKKPFTNTVCIRYPNGIVVHPSCSKDKHICPVTGEIFR